ncbi:MAG: hypothetical protein MI867_19390 [Pseudomonadales bacterium]|nr:hypothetical protein [Pseudomonadales bacterium]
MSYQLENNRLSHMLAIVLLLIAGAASGKVMALQLGQPVNIIPNPELPDQAQVDTSNNNLDVVMHNGELYFAWRTSTSHFASANTLLQVMRQTQSGEWVYEHSIFTGRDLREPRFLSLNGELFLYFAELGINPIAFQPGKTLFTRMDSQGQWQDTQVLFDDGFIPWRINFVDDQPIMIGYKGGETIYETDQSELSLMLLTTADGIQWQPAFNDDGVVLRSGLSETDFVITDQYLVAVGRNEAGDADGWGSKVCRAPLDNLSQWHCMPDRRKYDSPLVLEQNGEVYLVARRQLMYGGNYDLRWRNLSFQFQNILYQAFYWLSPKRCSVWRVDVNELAVDWLEDLPSAGDTCFPSAIRQSDGSFDIYNYSSDYNSGSRWSWLKGQVSPTHIYKINLKLN